MKMMRNRVIRIAIAVNLLLASGQVLMGFSGDHPPMTADIPTWCCKDEAGTGGQFCCSDCICTITDPACYKESHCTIYPD